MSAAASSSAKNILITGQPGCGKTTLIRKLSEEFRESGPAGFFTEEIRERGVRRGFRIMSIGGKEAGVLAHVDIPGPPRVGKYGVDLPGFERFLGTARLADRPQRLVIIDEIGKMECFSDKFRSLVVSLLDGPAPVIATIALKAGGFIAEVKRRPDVRLCEITERNREKLLAEISGLVRTALDS